MIKDTLNTGNKDIKDIKDQIPQEKKQEQVFPETPVFHNPGISETPTVTLVSENDAYIADRMNSQPKTLEEVLKIEEKKYAPGEHRLSLPKELKPYEKDFAFRWINKTKRAVDEAIDLKGWVIVNKALFPKLSKHLFTTSGAIERGDAILGFMNLKRAEKMRQEPILKSKAQREGNLILTSELPKLSPGESGFYKPEDKQAAIEDAGGQVSGFQEGRDF